MGEQVLQNYVAGEIAEHYTEKYGPDAGQRVHEALTAAPAPLSPEREAEVRAWLAELGARKDFTAVGPYNALRDALAELDRVRTEVRTEGQRYDEVAAELDNVRHDLQGALGTVDREKERADRAEAQRDSLARRVAELEAAMAAEPLATDGAVMQARRAIHAANDGPVPTEGGESR